MSSEITTTICQMPRDVIDVCKLINLVALTDGYCNRLKQVNIRSLILKPAVDKFHLLVLLSDWSVGSFNLSAGGA